MNDRRDQLWRQLVSQAKSAPATPPLVPDDEFVARVLCRCREQSPLLLTPTWHSSLAAGVASLALAASLLLALWHWPLIEATWLPRPEPWQLVVLVEP